MDFDYFAAKMLQISVIGFDELRPSSFEKVDELWRFSLSPRLPTFPLTARSYALVCNCVSFAI